MKRRFTLSILLLISVSMLFSQKINTSDSKVETGNSIKNVQIHSSEEMPKSNQTFENHFQNQFTGLKEIKSPIGYPEKQFAHPNDNLYSYPDFPAILGGFSPRSPLPLDYATEFNGSLDGWTSVSIVGGKNFEWTTTGGAFGGQLNSTTASNGYAMFDNLNGANIGPNPAEAALVSPALDFSGALGVLMSFEHMARHLGQGFNAAYPNLLIKVEASTDLFNTDIQEIWSYQFPSTAHMVVQGQQLVDLGALAGESEVHVRFRYIGGGGYWWLIDDIDIFATFNNDLTIAQAKFSQDLNFEGDDVTLSALITNLGLQTQTNVTVTFNVDGQDFFGIIPSIAPLETLEVSTQWINASAGRHLITVTVPNDENNANNTGTTQGVVAAIGHLAEGFEGTLFPPANWEADPEWINWVQTWSSQWEGLKSAAAGNNLGFTDSKLITPLLNIETGDELNFYATVGNNIVGQPTTIQVQYSQDKNTWTNIGSLIPLTPVMTLYTIDLGILAGDSYYLTFSATGAPSGASWSTWAIVDHIVGPELNIPDCPNPVNLGISNITASSADISWNLGGSETLWNVEVGLPGFIPGTGDHVSQIFGYDKTSWPASGLTEGTNYEFYVQADCGAKDVSDWAGPGTFTTYCEFECPLGGIPETEACGDTINNGCNLVITPMFESINPGDIICGTVWAEGGTRDTDWFELILTEPSVVILHAFAEAPVLFGLLNYGSGTPGNPVCPATAFIENEITALCSPTALNLGVLVAGTHWIFTGLPVFEGYPCDIKYWIEFEVIEVECAPPTDLTATNITATSADLGWTAGGIETMWNVEVGEPGFVPGTAAEILSITGTTDNPWTASPLASATEYEFYVQADCGGVTRSLSDWAGPFTFITECLPFGLPLAENFDAATPDEVPICWDRESNTVPWRVTSGIVPNSEPHSMATFYDATLPKDDWFYTPALELTGGVSYYVQFYLRAPGWGGTGEKLAVKWGDAPVASAMTAGTIYTNMDIQYADWTWVGGSFTPATTGLYYIGWHAFSDEDLDYIAVDDIQIDLSHPVTFNVDITTIDGFNHDTEVIYLAGSFPGAVWNQPGSNPDLLMERVGLTDVYTITLDLPVGWFEYKYFRNATWDFGEWAGGPNRTLAVDDVTETFDVFGGVIEWANLQAPENGNIPEGGDMQVWGQVYIPNGITEAPGATFGLEAWVGVHNENTDPAGWTSWVPATFNVQQFSNDEFHTLIGEDLVPGTYYYAFRYRFGQIYGEYVYGGYNSGFWDGITNVSGVLTVTPAGPPPYILVDGAVDDCVDATDEVEILGATVENGAIADIRSGGIITATDFEVKDGGTAYLTAATSITLGNEVLITPGATGLFLAKIDTFDPCVLPLALVASVDEVIPVIPAATSLFKVFPNPTTSTFKLELLGADEAAGINVEINGMMGERVFQDVLFGAMIYEFDLSNMPKGIYFIRVLMGDEMGIEKVIKQ